MDETITAIDTITLRIPLDIWAPPPMSQGVPRTHVESLYVRVTTSGGVVGWGESFVTAGFKLKAPTSKKVGAFFVCLLSVVINVFTCNT